MSEYLEAISRLNMPERTPGVDIPRSLYMIPRNDTPYHKNRIMAETLNTPLPKYSIPQVFILPEQDQIYEFELDKQFTLAKGGRKSIAIRNIKINSKFNDYLEKTFEFKLTININLSYYTGTADNGIYYFADGTKSFEYPVENTYEVTFQSTIPALKENLIKTINDNYAAYLQTSINQTAPTIAKFDNIKITLTDLGNGVYTFYISDAVRVVDIHSINFYVGSTINIYDFISSIKATDIRVSKDPRKEVKDTFTLDCSGLIYTKPNTIFVCSSLNPWSPSNIIGTLSENFSILNRIFPYDNQQVFKVWFSSDSGVRVPINKFFSGYIELELIIDNENNFAIDDD